MIRTRPARLPSSAPKRTQHGGTLLGIFIGLMIGAILAAVAAWMLSKDKPFRDPVTAPAAPVISSQPPATLPGKPGDTPIEKQDYDFYKILPNGDTPKPSAPSPTTANANTGNSSTATAPERFYLQVGSFEDPSEADNMRAMLTLNGLAPITQRVQLPDGRIVHRVRLGPYTRPEDMKSTQSRLAQAGFTANVVR